MLYTETVETGTLELLKRLSSKNYLEQFVLVGGTALALQIGQDFYDIYYLLQIMPLESILNNYEKMYKHQSTFHVLKSLVYFQDAEVDPNPMMLDKDISWDIVKKYITDVVKKI